MKCSLCKMEIDKDQQCITLGTAVLHAELGCLESVRRDERKKLVDLRGWLLRFHPTVLGIYDAECAKQPPKE